MQRYKTEKGNSGGGGGRKPKKQNIKILINHEAIVFEGQVF